MAALSKGPIIGAFLGPAAHLASPGAAEDPTGGLGGAQQFLLIM